MKSRNYRTSVRIILFVLSFWFIGFAGARKNPKEWTDVDYVAATGKTRQQLLDTGDYWPIEAFVPVTRNSTVADQPKLDPQQRAEIRRTVKFILYTPSNAISLGTTTASGHTDFYPNGGDWQPSCPGDGSIFGSLVGTCSHAKATEYFARSVTGELLLGCPCNSWDDFKARKCDCRSTTGGRLLGEYCPANTQGFYHLEIQ